MLKSMSLRSKLNIIDEWLAVDSQDSRAMGDVLTALRGPDGGWSPLLKLQTTAVIRAMAFPLLAQKGQAVGITSPAWTFNTNRTHVEIPFRRRFASSPSHFYNHVEWAAEALNIPIVYAKERKQNHD